MIIFSWENTKVKPCERMKSDVCIVVEQTQLIYALQIRPKRGVSCTLQCTFETMQSKITMKTNYAIFKFDNGDSRLNPYYWVTRKWLLLYKKKLIKELNSHSDKIIIRLNKIITLFLTRKNPLKLRNRSITQRIKFSFGLASSWKRLLLLI